MRTTTVIAYRVAPNSEHRAATELRQAGIRAYVPRDRGRKRNPFTKSHPAPAPGYVFAAAAYRPAFEKHVRSVIGSVSKAEISRLYLKRQARRADVPCSYAIGQRVLIGELSGTVLEIRGRTCIVRVNLFGKAHQQAIPYGKLRP